MKKKDEYFMNLAIQISTGSKCVRAKYGTVLVSKDGRVVGTGFNGKPRGSCNDHICYREGLQPNSPKENCCIHSEANAIMFTNPLDREGGTAYVSGICCLDCMLLLLQSGVSRIVYLDSEESNGHKGSSTYESWEKYGCNVEVVAFRFDKYKEINV